MESIEERLVRLETKVDILLARTNEQNAYTARLEGRIWGVLLLAITGLLGLVGTLISTAL